MAAIGDQLMQPESGWRRYDDEHPGFQRNGTWSRYSNVLCYGGSYYFSQQLNSSIIFKIYSDKIRIISPVSRFQSSDITIKIDGVEVAHYNTYATSNVQHQTLVYEKVGLSFDYHVIELINNINNKELVVDAIDIDEDGYIIASIGSQLINPEPGWKRYDDFLMPAIRRGTWNKARDSSSIWTARCTGGASGCRSRGSSWRGSEGAARSF